jgi:DNA repair exonuclease SbcCD ATPase subunit
MGINYKLLALDEVDQALDEDGKDSYVEIIKKFQDKYKILVITHDARLQSKFPYILSVDNDKDNGATINIIKD